MNRFHLATFTLLAGTLLAAGCAGPCGGCGRTSLFERRAMRRASGALPCEYGGNSGIEGIGVLTGSSGGCASCGSGGAPISDGPILEPSAPPLTAIPPAGQMVSPPGLMPGPMSGQMPPPIPPALGAPSDPLAAPSNERFVPSPAPVVPANPSSRKRK